MSRLLLSLHPTVCLLAAASSLTIALTAHAGTITAPGRSLFPANSTGQVGPFGSTPAPNNDGSTVASPNRINYQVFANTNGTMDVEFLVTDSGGVTEYFVSQAWFNLTGQSWAGFHLELGFGVGSSFQRSGSGDFLSFDLDDVGPPAGSPRFGSVAIDFDTLDFSGGLVSGPAPLPMGFTIDVPDRLASWNPEGRNSFTLRQLPVLSAVPEPGSASLFLIGALAMLGLRKQRRRA